MLTATDLNEIESVNPVLLSPPISVIGLGYVGVVSAACFADLRHSVIGVDAVWTFTAALTN